VLGRIKTPVTPKHSAQTLIDIAANLAKEYPTTATGE
jgi:hypothetical protein